MTRTRRVASSAALSLGSQVVAIVVGLWLTRFILDRVGQHDYGLWLIMLQALGYLALADLGVVGLLPRQAAFTTGRNAAAEALPRLVGEATRLVLWQVPAVALLCALTWLVIPLHGDARLVLGIVLLVFTAAFPLRLFGAVLQGLQDLVFLGWLQFFSWLASTAVVIAGVLMGLNLYALALGWGVTQLGPPLVAWWRLAQRHPEARPWPLPRLPWAAARTYLSSALWVSLGQLATVLGSGADVLIIGFVMGPAAVVPYVMTLKLLTVVGNFPTTLIHASGPALSQMRAGESPTDLRRATSALAQAVLIASGAVACVVVAVNRGFVGWWVGADLFAGHLITLLGVALMLLGHYATTVAYTAFSFGYERRVALARVVAGLIGAACGIALVKLMGPAGAALGGIIGVVAFLPMVLPPIASHAGISSAGALAVHVTLALRIALAIGAAAAIGSMVAPRGPVSLAFVSLLAAVLYTTLLLPVVLRPPLREYALQLWHAVRDRWRTGGAALPPGSPSSAVA